VGDAAAGNGLWQWHDLLAPLAGVAAGRGVAETHHALLKTSSGKPSKLIGPGRRLTPPASPLRGGEKTEPNPTDAAIGTKRHLVVDRQGIPLAVTLSAATCTTAR